MAAERGGNCDLTEPGKTTIHNGVTIMGNTHLAGDLPVNASSLYARNLYAFIEIMIDRETGELAIDWDDEIITGTALTRDGKIIHPRLLDEGV